MNGAISRLTRNAGPREPAGDGPLLDAFLAGDSSAFAALVQRHAALVFATCRRVLRHRQDAEDAFQATFLVLARRAADVWPREAVGSWLFGVAQRVALKARAARERRAAGRQPLAEVAAPDRPRPDADLAETVHRTVAKLPDVYRAAVVACDLQGLSRKEAAERLGWSEGTLSGRLARARGLLERRFRRLGLALPTGGVVGLLAAPGSVSATVVRATTELATEIGAAGASAPVAALTEGVVRSMKLFKFKATAAVLFVSCALGYGAVAATGAGDDPVARQPAETPKRGPGGSSGAAGAKPPVPLKAASDRDRLQGTWRVVSVTENGKTVGTNAKDPWVIEVSGSTLTMPYPEGGGSSGSTGSSSGSSAGGSTGSSSSGSSGSSGTGTGASSSSGGVIENTGTTVGLTASGSFGGTAGFGWKRREFTFAVDGVKVPRTIDLTAKDAPVGRGIYEFTAPASVCAKCHSDGIARGVVPTALAACERLSKSIPPDPKQSLAVELGVRLALGIDGKRPTAFGGDGVIVFELKRADPEEEKRARLLNEKLLYATRLQAATDALEKEKLRAELAAVMIQLEELAVRDNQQQALVRLRLAEAQYEQARAQVLVAQADAQRASAQLESAKAMVAEAEKALTDLKKWKPQPRAAAGGPEFTVIVRTLTAADKVIRVKATGSQTVLEGLVYAADDVSLKSDGISVWVVRDRTVMPVDLAGITKKGETKSNYVLKAGDQLFVETKAGK